jgi:hypothetical protein
VAIGGLGLEKVNNRLCKKMENTKLTSTVSVKQYRDFKKKKDRDKIADLIFERFYERYLGPFHYRTLFRYLGRALIV